MAGNVKVLSLMLLPPIITHLMHVPIS